MHKVRGGRFVQNAIPGNRFIAYNKEGKKRGRFTSEKRRTGGGSARGRDEKEGRRARCHITPHIWKETGPRRCWPELGARRPVTKGDCIETGVRRPAPSGLPEGTVSRPPVPYAGRSSAKSGYIAKLFFGVSLRFENRPVFGFTISFPWRYCTA